MFAKTSCVLVSVVSVKPSRVKLVCLNNTRRVETGQYPVIHHSKTGMVGLHITAAWCAVAVDEGAPVFVCSLLVR